MSLTITGGQFFGGRELEAQIIKAFDEWAKEDVNDHFYDEFHDVKWDYDREGEEVKTRRKNPQAPIRDAGSPRDIIDYGNLYESGKKSFKLTASALGSFADWSWDARGDSGYCYAVDVHEGLGTSAGNPRRWTDDVRIPQKFDNSMLKPLLAGRIQAAISVK